jgi:hypothetical protein
MSLIDRVSEIFIRCCFDAAEIQNGDGGFAGGHNGPYGDPDTEVRNTAHWLYSFCVAFELTANPVFKRAADRSASFLKQKYINDGATIFECRRVLKKDTTNGVVGQAWSIEGLAKAGVTLSDAECTDISIKLFEIHDYDKPRKVWHTVLPDGTQGKIDRTFNHQLWFCAAGVEAYSFAQKSLPTSITSFIEALPKRIATYPDGIIRHSQAGFGVSFLAEPIRFAFNTIRYTKDRHSIRKKSIGYHLFNTFALAVIHCYNSYFLAELPKNIMDVVASEDFHRELDDNYFGFPYNPPGFEAAFSLAVLEPTAGCEINKWLEKQLVETYSEELNEFTLGVHDKKTSQARIYELARFLHYTTN